MPRSNGTSRRVTRFAVAFVALACGLYVSVAFSDRGWLVPRPGSLFATPEAREGEYDLQALTILNRALLQVKDNYVEPERIDPSRMLAYALNAIQEEVPQVVASFDTDLDAGPQRVQLQVDRATAAFEIGGIGSLWEMSSRLREIFRFVQENLDDQDVDLRLVEYAAINGMLDTLDPHSVLLAPQVFADMQANNRGSFGGLGIVISIRDGQLTIISPIDDTPAHRAGLRSGDKILKIGEESTINMNIEEAVSRLRGDPGTAVDIEVMREGWTLPHEFTIVREIISIRSVKSQVLGNGIGYIEITNFQANTHDDLRAHLARLREEMGEMRGLVLDLRDNPGGLLEQAILVADTFLDDGTIVTTVGEGHRLREEKKATRAGTEPFYPIVVLVNPGSASASEIVAGALQNHGRALVIGDRTFGKGSVQVLYEFHDGSALKLTIAQYLTPGDVSIQSVGIVPDIGVIPMSVDEEVVDLYPSERVVREGDLAAHLSSERAAALRTPDSLIRYYRQREVADPTAIVLPDRFEVDFEIDFARQLLEAAGTAWRVEDFLRMTNGTRERIELEQIAIAGEHLAALGIDWTAGPSPTPDTLAVRFSTDRPGNRVAAGEPIQLTLEVTNSGRHPIHRLRAVSRSSYRLFDDLEFAFGYLAAGETRRFSVPVEVPVEDITRFDRVELRFRADEQELAVVEHGDLEILGRERPHFGFSYQIVDDEAGNGDGLLQLHERVSFRLTVTNIGAGASEELLVYLKNEAEAAILLERGREVWQDGLEAGATRTAEFQFQVQRVPPGGVVRFEIATLDTVFREFSSQKIEIPLRPDGDLFRPAVGRVRLVTDTAIWSGAHESTSRLSTGEAGHVLEQLGTLDGWVRVAWADGAIGWVPGEAIETASAGATPVTLPPVSALQPPVVNVDNEVLWSDTSTFRLHGTITDDILVEDYYIWVSGEEGSQRRRVKVVYDHAGAAFHEFTQDVPLYPGTNRIVVIARDSDRMIGSDTVFIYRRTSAPALSNAPERSAPDTRTP
jgi:carboxyl-terminal processing protease